MKFQTQHDRAAEVGKKHFGEEEESRSMTKQSFAKEADINNIMAKYQKTGILGDPFASRKPAFGDYTESMDFVTQQNMVASAKSDFELLPSAIRNRFDNSVEDLIEFINDPENAEEAKEMGLIGHEIPLELNEGEHVQPNEAEGVEATEGDTEAVTQ